MSDYSKRSRQWDADNMAAAAIIMADPAKYPGVMQEWAALVLADDFKLTPPNWGCAA